MMDIDTYDDAHSHRRHLLGWKLQRGFHIVVALLLLLGGLGLFGNGLWATTRIRLSSTTELQYDRFARLENTDPIRLVYAGNPGASYSLAFPLEFFRNYTVESLEPKPIETKTTGPLQTYVFAPTAQDGRIFFRIQAHKPGRHTYTLQVQGQPVEFDQMVWP